MKAVVVLAREIDKRLVAQYQDYLDDCARNAKNEHRPHYCEHGTDQWVDYDNICGPCEDGITSADPLQRRYRALAEAHDRLHQANTVSKAWLTLRQYGVGHAVDDRTISLHIGDLLTV